MYIPVVIDRRLKSKIETIKDLSKDDNNTCYIVKFKDLEDSFYFESRDELQEFLHSQEVERFYDKSLRKGYFDYVNEHNETMRYHVETKRGTFTLLKDECLGVVTR